MTYIPIPAVATAMSHSLTAGTHLAGGPFDGSASVTLTTDAASTNTTSTLVTRDGSGNFAAGTITAALAGNATTATSATSATSATNATTATNVSGGTVNATTAAFSKEARLQNTTVAGLTAAGTAGVGALSFVTDATTTAILGLGLAVTGGGANKVVVYSDGTNWLII